jgi:hypothetical protein
MGPERLRLGYPLRRRILPCHHHNSICSAV